MHMHNMHVHVHFQHGMFLKWITLKTRFEVPVQLYVQTMKLSTFGISPRHSGRAFCLGFSSRKTAVGHKILS